MSDDYDFSFEVQFLVVDDLFERYSILVNCTSRTTSVYCEECDDWVIEWEGDKFTTLTDTELFEKITDEHKLQVMGPEVEISDNDREII